MAYTLLRTTLAPWFLHRLGTLEGVEHIPRTGPFIVAANHVSYIEPALIGALINWRTAQKVFSPTKESIYSIFQKFRLTNYLGMILVPKEDKSRVVENCLIKLCEGFPVMIFPEGARSPAGTMSEARTGAARLALLSGAPVVPVGYRGPIGRTMVEAIRNILMRTKESRIRVGAPLTFSANGQPPITKELLTETTRTIMHAVAALAGTTYPY